ncbi:MAG: hypothetical protein ACSW8A_04965 [Lachnospiraceae bacterium]
MLKKLIKHDFKDLAAYYMPLLLGFIGISVIFLIFFNIMLRSENSITAVLGLISMVAYIIGLAAVALLSVWIIVYSFYKITVSDEGYLAMTLPVKPSEHIGALMIAGAIWMAITIAIYLLSLSAVFLISKRTLNLNLSWNDIKLYLNYAGLSMGREFELSAPVIILTVLRGLVYLFTCGLLPFLAIALGQMTKQHKIFFAVLFYMGINMVVSTITALIVEQATSLTFTLQVAINLAISIIVSIIYFLVTDYILENKLNL